MQTTQSIAPNIPLTDLNEPVVLRYFETLNAANFEAASELFAPDGILHPPFETQVIGKVAILTYLQAEAKDLQLYPQQATVTELESGFTEIQVKGQVQTPVFKVNVLWRFLLTPQREIGVVQVKLLASLRELMGLRR